MKILLQVFQYNPDGSLLSTIAFKVLWFPLLLDSKYRNFIHDFSRISSKQLTPRRSERGTNWIDYASPSSPRN
jgi:hypothetical protein